MQLDAGFVDHTNYMSFISVLCAPMVEEPQRLPVCVPDRTMVTFGHLLARHVEAYTLTSKMRQAGQNFLALILLSFCIVLENLGAGPEEIGSVMKCVTNFRAADRKKQMKHVRLIHGLITRLSKEGLLVSRATELFMISMPPIMPCSSEADRNPDSITVTGLRDMNEDFMGKVFESVAEMNMIRADYADCCITHFTIPGILVHMIAATNISNKPS